jgi:predicted glycosyltransferase
MKKVVFYYNHYEDMGHAVRLTNLFFALDRAAKKQISISVFQSGRSQNYIRWPSGVKIFDLPFPFTSRSNLIGQSKIDTAKIAQRIQFMLSKLREIKPDAFITEFFPFGRFESRIEALPVLKILKANNIKIFCSLFLPYLAHDEASMSELRSILSYYDRVFIHTPKGLDSSYIEKFIAEGSPISPETYRLFFQEIKTKIHHTGYIFNEIRQDTKSPLCKKNDYILVYRGAGAYSSDIISCAIRANGLLRGSRRKNFIIVTGPATSSEEMKHFKRLAAQNQRHKNIVIEKFIPDFVNYVRDASVCVGTAGNTAYEIMRYKKRSVLIPFRGLAGQKRIDQLARAEMLKKTLGACILDYDSLDPRILADAIETQLRKSDKEIDGIKPSWFEGAQNMAQALLKSLDT